MIYDSLIRLPQYLPHDVWIALEPFFKQLNAETPDGKYFLRGRDIFAGVQSYKTRSQNEGRIEAHEQYIDIQATLDGAEEIDVFPIEVLESETAYDDQNDVRFYKPHNILFARFHLQPGYFALFFPPDAHRPQIIIGDIRQNVKKVVVKIKRELLF